MSKVTALACDLQNVLYSKLCQSTEEGIFILNADFRYVAANDSYIQLFGCDHSALIGRLFGLFQSQFIASATLRLIKKALFRLPPNQPYQRELVAMTKYGVELPLSLTIWHMTLEGQSYYLGECRDMSLVYKDQQTIQHLQNYNQVTNLPNRLFFARKLSDILIDTYQEVVVVRISIDSYRLLVGILGQKDVDHLMRQFVQRITDLNLAHLQCFANFAGEDFAMLFELPEANMVRNQLDSLMQLCELPFSVNQHTLYVHISVGVSYYPADGQQVDTLLSNAEKSLEYIKHHGGDDICWFASKLNHKDLIDIKLESELRQAFDESQFVAQYQPKIDLTSGLIVGFEALVRWQHPSRGLLAPADFISAVITHKLSFELFFQMAEQVVTLLAKWQSLGLKAHLSLNADAAEFNQLNFVSGMKDLITSYDLIPSDIHIELTESSIMLQQQTVKDQLTALKSLGICLALDDFGTGYASLSYLQEFPFDFIKVDKSFLVDITQQPTQQHIVKAIIDLGAALDMQIIAEGIEHSDQHQLLAGLGCQFGQGYLFGKPMSAEHATSLLKAQAHSSVSF